MKQTTRTRLRFAAAAAIAAISATAVLAIGSRMAVARNRHGVAGHHGADHAAVFEHIAAALGLSHQQKATARKLHDQAAAKAAPLVKQARLQHDEIEAMLESGSADPTELGERVIELYATHKQLEAVHDQTLSKLRAQLSATQRATLEKLLDEHGPFQAGFLSPGRSGSRR